jgi:hypothetical protein
MARGIVTRAPAGRHTVRLTGRDPDTAAALNQMSARAT